MRQNVKYFLLFVILTIASCSSFQKKKNDQTPLSYSPRAQTATIEHAKVFNNLVQKNSRDPLVKRMLNYQKNYYSDMHKDLDDLLLKTSANLKSRDLKEARKMAIKHLINDAKLMDEVKDYAVSIDNENENNAYIRFGHNRAPFILRSAAQFLENDDYFAAIVSGKYYDQFDWKQPTFLGGIKNIDDKGTVAISALTASMLYLLDDKTREENLSNHSSIIYNESISETLAENPELLKKVEENYHLYLPSNQLLFKVYEGYEFGGNKDLPQKDKYLPLDCSTGISMILGFNETPFFTGHLASYYDEFFEENSSYWRASDWEVRRKIIKNLKPFKAEHLTKLKPGSIIVTRSLKSAKALKNPNGYLGSGGHIAVVVGVKGNDLYTISWARNLEYENKIGLGIDVININKTQGDIKNGKLILFGYYTILTS